MLDSPFPSPLRHTHHPSCSSFDPQMIGPAAAVGLLRPPPPSAPPPQATSELHGAVAAWRQEEASASAAPQQVATSGLGGKRHRPPPPRRRPLPPTTMTGASGDGLGSRDIMLLGPSRAVGYCCCRHRRWAHPYITLRQQRSRPAPLGKIPQYFQSPCSESIGVASINLRFV